MDSNYIPLFSAKGYSKELKEWIYGWHWTEIVSQNNDPINHYIRKENKDYKCDSASIGFYTGAKDKNGIPIFTGDKVVFNDVNNKEKVGIITYSVFDSSYKIKTGTPEWSLGIIKKDNIMIIGTNYEIPEIHTVNLQFRQDNVEENDIIEGLNEYCLVFGKYPTEILLTTKQMEHLLLSSKNIEDFGKRIRKNYGINSISVDWGEENE